MSNKNNTNAASKKQVQTAGKKQDKRREKELNDLRVVLNTQAGRRVLWRIMERCGLYKISFDGSSRTFFNEGQRNIGLFLTSEINDADAELMGKMMSEANKVKKELDNEE